MTNGQQVLEVSNKSTELYNQYNEYLSSILSEDTPVFTEKNLLKLNDLGLKYFNFIESSVGKSSLLGAHLNDRWVLDLAETCYNALEALCVHTEIIREKSSELNMPAMGQYNTHAFANMQRMVMEYLPETSEGLKQKLIASNIPIEGFNNMQNFNGRSKIAPWQWWVAIFGGVIALGLGYLLFFHATDLNESQKKYINVFLSLSASMLSVLIPGLFSIEGKIRQMSFTAVGGFAIFCAIFFS